MSDVILKLHDITKVFYEGAKKTTACDRVSFKVHAGTAVSLLGLNGAGKSTLINIISTQLEPTSGSAEIFGYSLDAPLEIKKRLGVLHERNPLYENMRVIDFLRFCQNMYGITDAELIDSVCEQWNLSTVQYLPIRNLSKGFKQRVGLAACLVHRPALLILDEPTSGLDAVQQAEFEKNIANLLPETTLLLCTHDLEHAARLCTEHILLAKGRVTAQGTVSDIAETLLSEPFDVISDETASSSTLRRAFEALSRH